MNLFAELRLRTSVVLLQFSTIIITLAVVGTALLFYVFKEFSRDNVQYAARASETMVERVETLLQDLTSHIQLIGAGYEIEEETNLRRYLSATETSYFSAIFVVGADATIKSATLADGSKSRERELRGVDISAYPLLQNVRRATGPIWSDKHISAITGNVTVGLALPLKGGEAVIAEVPLSKIVEVGNIFREKGHLDYWVIDSKGEIVVDTSGSSTQHINLSRLDIVQAGFAGQPQPDRMVFQGREYNVSATYSKDLGWLFVGRVPAGFANPDLRKILYIVLAFALGIAVFGLLLAPLWSRHITKPVSLVTQRASQIAAGSRPDDWPHGSIVEFNALTDDLMAMSNAIARREEELRVLNEQLESRVVERTHELMKTNSELKTALDDVDRVRDELVQSEKVAALGRMVAGISHELNTPLGNGRMAISTLATRLETFREHLTDPIDPSELNKFLETVAMSVEIAEHNMVRASDLVRSFKEVSADRTASRRRRVILKELLDEIKLTLLPTLKTSPIDLVVNAPPFISIDSYPGELGQVVTNLVENSTTHGFEGRDKGTITITVEQSSDDTVVLRVSDDGNGMSPDVVRKVFDPFFTTALGRGGTGLGLYIVHRAVGEVLGGTVEIKSAPGQGTEFAITIPVVAPDLEDADTARSMSVG